MALMIRNPTKHTFSGSMIDLQAATEIPYVKPLFRLYQLYMASSHRPPHMRKAGNGGFYNGDGKNLQNIRNLPPVSAGKNGLKSIIQP